MPRRWRILVLSVGLVGTLAAWGVWNRSDAPLQSVPDPVPEPDDPLADPRSAFVTEFRNVRPDVKYVGDGACAQCHTRIARTFREHPMGRSAEWVSRGPTATDHAAGANNHFTSSGYSLGVERMGDRLSHVVSVAQGDDNSPRYAVVADLAIGSGTHGRSYLTVDRGAVWQSPISWFGRAQGWDVSPGFNLAKELRRPVLARCLLCHTDRPEPVPDSINRYREPLLQVQLSIGCERCHGPGELHVAERSRSAPLLPDHSIVNPRHLPAELKADVCRQCHLQGAAQIPRRGRDPSEYRPGLPWERFLTTFLRHPDLTDSRKSVGQFEQLELSRCFAGSGGQLGCTSCHDPHAKPAASETAAYFRSRCLSCHGSRGCSLPVAQRQEKQDSCTACHMPARDSSNVAHVAVTDHRIMRRPDEGRPRAQALTPDQMPLVAYRAGPYAPGDAERDRDLMIAVGNEFAIGGAPPDRWRVVEAGLDRSLERWPQDAPAWLTRSRVSAARGDSARAVQAARAAVDLNPDSEVALVQLAGTAVAADEFESAIRAAGALIELNPSSPDHLLTRASAHFARNDWVRAEADCNAALALQSVRPNARFMLAVCLHKRGDPAAGRRELELALKMTPAPEMRTTLSTWYGQLTR